MKLIIAPDSLQLVLLIVMTDASAALICFLFLFPLRLEAKKLLLTGRIDVIVSTYLKRFCIVLAELMISPRGPPIAKKSKFFVIYLISDK